MTVAGGLPAGIVSSARRLVDPPRSADSPRESGAPSSCLFRTARVGLSTRQESRSEPWLVPESPGMPRHSRKAAEEDRPAGRPQAQAAVSGGSCGQQSLRSERAPGTGCGIFCNRV